jgi:hypothetical protein
VRVGCSLLNASDKEFNQARVGAGFIGFSLINTFTRPLLILNSSRRGNQRRGDSQPCLLLNPARHSHHPFATAFEATQIIPNPARHSHHLFATAIEATQISSAFKLERKPS